MADAFQLSDPRNAQAFLKELPGESRRKGEQWVRAGMVHDLEAVKPGTHYRAVVGDTRRYQVDLEYDGFEGWLGDCECAEEIDCEHVYAALHALLAEHSTAMVRRLSAGSFPASEPATQRPPPAGELPTLATQLTASLGRPLRRPELDFLGKVHRMYAVCRQTGRVTAFDFSELGMPFRTQGLDWHPLEIWPALPANEHEFWLYLAEAAREHGAPIPEFMQPVSDPGPIRERLQRWQRGRQIEEWSRLLGEFEGAPAALAPAPPALTDLRLRVMPKETRVEWLRPGRSEFEAMTATQFGQLSRQGGFGTYRLTPEAELLWSLLAPQFYFGPNLRFDNPDVARSLGSVLRSNLLVSRVVDAEGQPLQRPAEALRWGLAPATSADDDYRLHLAQANGEPVPFCLAILPGQPTLYLTPHAVYPGPPQPHGLNPFGETRIPAPALEQASGVAFLNALQVPLPPRVQERLRCLPLTVTFRCELRPPSGYNRTEDCVFVVSAEAADGHREEHQGRGWQITGKARPPHKQSDLPPGITLYDRASLAQADALLEPFNLKRDPYGAGLVCRVTRKFPEQFATWLRAVPPEMKVQLEGELASFALDAVAGSVRLDVSEAEIDWFDLRVVLNVSDTTLTPPEIKLLLNAKGGYVRLAGKGWRRLQFDLSPEEDERLARLGLSPRELSAEPQRLHALQLADEAAQKFLPAQQVEQIQRRVGDLKARVAPPLPAGVVAQLRPYQLEGFHFLAYLAANRFGGILADDMGLGKTLQALAWLLWLREPAPVPKPVNGEAVAASAVATGTAGEPPAARPTLVVCPKSVMDNWRAEAERFTPGLRVKVWTPAEVGGLSEGLGLADLHVINYAQLRSLGESLVAVEWLAVVLDEGQYIKNPSSQTAQIARALHARHRLVLSGTPIENRLLDLWSLMAFAMPGLLGSRAQFGKLYDAKGDPFARRRLSSRVRPFLLRRTKTQVASDLPDRIEEDLFCEIEGEQQTLYRAELKRAQQLLLGIRTPKELAEQQFHFLVSLLRLRQICCHPKLVHPGVRGESAKTTALLEHLEPLMEEGEKVLVFSQFVTMLDLLRPELEVRGWPVFYLAGNTENRGDLVRNFQSADGAAVFLISLKAGGFGLNLTAASYVVLCDPWWNPAVENQAIDRTHRIGQDRKVIAYRLLIKHSIEEKIRELQRKKQALAEEVLGEERFAQSLTLDDLKFLFAD